MPVVLRVFCAEPEMLQDWAVDNINTRAHGGRTWGTAIGLTGHSSAADGNEAECIAAIAGEVGVDCSNSTSRSTSLQEGLNQVASTVHPVAALIRRLLTHEGLHGMDNKQLVLLKFVIPGLHLTADMCGERI